MGTDVIAKGKNNRHEKYPARQKRYVPMDATNTFKTSAEGRINFGGNPNSPIAAKYPDAPACPTDEYRSAAMKISPASRIVWSMWRVPTDARLYHGW